MCNACARRGLENSHRQAVQASTHAPLHVHRAICARVLRARAAHYSRSRRSRGATCWHHDISFLNLRTHTDQAIRGCFPSHRVCTHTHAGCARGRPAHPAGRSFPATRGRRGDSSSRRSRPRPRDRLLPCTLFTAVGAAVDSLVGSQARRPARSSVYREAGQTYPSGRPAPRRPVVGSQRLGARWRRAGAP